MQLGGRLRAAIEILDTVFGGRPASLALADWGRSHRFAGSGDRAAIGNLVYDCLRRRHSLAYLMQSHTPRALALAALRWTWELDPERITTVCDGQGFAPVPLTAGELANLTKGHLDGAPRWVLGDYPEWLDPLFYEAFGEDAAAEGTALARRAPVDVRVNTLKSTRDKVLHAFTRHDAEPTPFSLLGVRLPPPRGDGRTANIEANPAYARGYIEVQDEGSQLAALATGASPRLQVADICAGGGGKTLALAAAMQNTGQVYAYDADPARFRPIFDRLKRAGARNVQTLPPGKEEELVALELRMDAVLIDAPCSGSGVWRRKPDAKWRLTRAQLDARAATQKTLLLKGAGLVKEGGSLVYVTCSVLPEENERQVAAFLAGNAAFEPLDREILLDRLRMTSNDLKATCNGVLLTPRLSQTDGFFISVLQKRG